MRAEDWPAPDAAATEYAMQELLGALDMMLRPKLVVETGTYQGHAAQVMGRACHDAGVGRVVTCDPDDKFIEIIEHRIHDLPIEYRKCRGIDLPELRQADFVFCDSAYDARAAEIALCKEGAVVVVHDTRVSYDSSVPPLEGLVRGMGGVAFNTYRGFGILVRGGEP